GVAPVLLLRLFDPRLQSPFVVIGPPQTQTAPIGGRHDRNFKTVLVVGNAQRGVMIAQQAEDLVVEPRRMTELKRHATRQGQQTEKGTQPWHILLESRWQLKQQWS